MLFNVHEIMKYMIDKQQIKIKTKFYYFDVTALNLVRFWFLVPACLRAPPALPNIIAYNQSIIS